MLDKFIILSQVKNFTWELKQQFIFVNFERTWNIYLWIMSSTTFLCINSRSLKIPFPVNFVLLVKKRKIANTGWTKKKKKCHKMLALIVFYSTPDRCSHSSGHVSSGVRQVSRQRNSLHCNCTLIKRNIFLFSHNLFHTWLNCSLTSPLSKSPDKVICVWRNSIASLKSFLNKFPVSKH